MAEELPDDSGLQLDESQPEPGLEAAAGEAPEGAPAPEGGEPGAEPEEPKLAEQLKNPETKKGYILGTQKYAGQVKALQAERDRLAAEAEALRAQSEFFSRQAERASVPAPEKPKLPEGVDENAVRSRVDPTIRETPIIKELVQEIQSLKARFNETVTARPESLVDSSDIPEDVMKEITPRLREASRKNGATDPQTLTIMARALAAPVMAKQLASLKVAAARQQKAAALRAAQTSPSGGAGESEPDIDDIAGMDQEALEKAFPGISGIGG
jgi:hypothetical protein